MNTTCKTTLTLAVAPIAMLTACQASSQAQSPFYLRLGVNNFQASGVRTGASRNGLDLGVGYTLPKSYLLKGLTTGAFELNFARHIGHGNDIAISSVDYVERFSFMKGSKFSPYVGLGVGAHRNRYSKNTRTFVSNGSNGSNGGGFFTNTLKSADRINIGGKVLVGANLSERFFVEGAMVLNGKASGSRFDAFSASLGIHF